jgi:hypothetical protein
MPIPYTIMPFALMSSVRKCIPVGEDGYGPLRPNKDIHLAVQSRNRAGPDKQPRVPATAEDMARGRLLPTCFALAGGEFRPWDSPGKVSWMVVAEHSSTGSDAHWRHKEGFVFFPLVRYGLLSGSCCLQGGPPKRFSRLAAIMIYCCTCACKTISR